MLEKTTQRDRLKIWPLMLIFQPPSLKPIVGWDRLIPPKKGQVAIMIKMAGFVIGPNLFELNLTQGSIKRCCLEL